MSIPLELPPVSALILALLPLLGSCESEVPTRPAAESIAIVLRVTGGLAGADFTLNVDGERRALEGLECVSLCDFERGEVLAGLSPQQILDLRDLALDGGLGVIESRSYGTECCDRFLYDLRYSQGGHQAHVVGDAATLPDPLARLAQRIRGMAQGTFPSLVALDTERNDWPGDRLIVHSAELAGGLLDVEISYSGGCEPHDLDLVAYGGFMESEPVQVRAALAHDGRDDACDALIRRELRFDLSPLHRAYDGTYPGSRGGPLVLQLQDPGGGPSFSFTLTWTPSDE